MPGAYRLRSCQCFEDAGTYSRANFDLGFGMLGHRADDLVVFDRGFGRRCGAMGSIVCFRTGAPTAAKRGE